MSIIIIGACKIETIYSDKLINNSYAYFLITSLVDMAEHRAQ